MVPLLLDDELEELLDDELLDDELVSPLDDELDDELDDDDEPLDDELVSPLDELPDDVFQFGVSPRLIAPSVSRAHAWAKSPAARATEAAAKIAKECDWWRIGSKCAVSDGASRGEKRTASRRDRCLQPFMLVAKNSVTKALRDVDAR